MLPHQCGRKPMDLISVGDSLPVLQIASTARAAVPSTDDCPSCIVTASAGPASPCRALACVSRYAYRQTAQHGQILPCPAQPHGQLAPFALSRLRRCPAPRRACPLRYAESDRLALRQMPALPNSQGRQPTHLDSCLFANPLDRSRTESEHVQRPVAMIGLPGWVSRSSLLLTPCVEGRYALSIRLSAPRP